MKIAVIMSAVLVLAACCARSAPAAPAIHPIALHPDNGHYFLWRGQPTMLIASGEHYGALLNLDFDYVRYFKTLQADGLNHINTPSPSSVDGGGISALKPLSSAQSVGRRSTKAELQMQEWPS